MTPNAEDQLNYDIYTRWREDERVWWDRYSAVMAHQWKLTPTLNWIVRRELDRYFFSSLFHREGALLDVGCGSGWLAVKFADKGMNVTGIDFSHEQIATAESLKRNSKRKNVHFECCDIVRWDANAHKNEYDSVFINAFLHHLHPDEIRRVIQNVSISLKPGGRLFMYEPLKTSRGRGRLPLRCIDAFFSKCVHLFFGLVPDLLGFWDSSFSKEREDGYRGLSPHEGPVEIELIEDACRNSLNIKCVKGWHLYSLGCAMQAMLFKPKIRNAYLPLIAIFYWLDVILFRVVGWRSFSGKSRFVLCTIIMEKEHLRG
jgi:2-polyprenyl-3-methyl-5-hydroxy-6-metoxy-1,4-benzoquinol methylase